MMRKVVYEAWQSSVREEVAARLPQLKEVPLKSGEWKKAIKYVLPNTSEQVSCYVVFRFLNDDEAFDVWAVWARSASVKFKPWFTMESINDFSRKEAFHTSLSIAGRNGASHWSLWQPTEAAVDDPQLFADEYAEHFFKDLSTEEARELVASSVLEAVKEIEDYVIPYLKRRIDAEFTA